MKKLLLAALLALCAPMVALAQPAAYTDHDPNNPTVRITVPVTPQTPLPVTGTFSASTSATASAAPTAVTAGTGKALNIGLFSNLFVTSVDGSGNIIDPNAALPAGTNIIGKFGIDQTTPGTTNLVQIGGSLPAGTNAIGNLGANTHAQCSALCANLVVKAAAGNLKTFEVSADSTLSGAIWYVMVYDAPTAPADGSVTPSKCYQQPSGTTQMGGSLGPGGSAHTTGITIGVSTTGCFTKTASTHAFIGADFQ